MKIHFYSPNRIEPWDYKNVFDIGIGGSETSHVELAIRLAKLGHDVVSYTDLPDKTKIEFRFGIYWKDLNDACLSDDGLWIIYRAPGVAFTPGEARRAWLICQDVFYHDWDTKSINEKFDKIFALCPRHVSHILERSPELAPKITLSGNGVNVERFESIISPVRDCYRLIWASSPDRGLKELLDIFERANDIVEQLNLHIFYGMDNIDKICGGDRQRLSWRDSWKQYDRACNMPNVTWHGRVGQTQLAIEYLKSGIWCYPTWFSETSCISCMEAQCLGAIPITNPIWATGYNVKHGVFIAGTPSDKLVMLRYVDAVTRIACGNQELIRKDMIPESRKRLSWNKIATQWSDLAEMYDVISA